MAAFYGDSSALVKQYIREVGSARIIELTAPAAGNRIYTALVTGAEIVAAVARRLRAGSITDSDATVAITAFRNQFRAQYGIVPVTDRIVERAMDLAEAHGLRGYDAIQLSCALVTRDRLATRRTPVLTFLSADSSLNAAAAAEGLIVENPNSYQ
ncbi:MAG: type II toxin-antitoxin system VapC family toxin [Dehalococcoidia bacterium]